MKSQKLKLILSIIGLAILIGLIILMIIDLIPLLEELIKNSDDESKSMGYIEAYGAKGVPVLILIQAIIVILTVIPGAVVQVLAGLCYGIWIGTLICIAGVVLGNFLVFFSLRQFKKLFMPIIKKRTENNEKKKDKLISIDTVNKMKHPEYLAFVIYLFPFIPNGIIPYIFAQSKITMSKYLLGITAASAPSILICSLLGDRLADRDFLTSIIIVIFIALVFCFAFIFRKKINEKIKSFEK